MASLKDCVLTLICAALVLGILLSVLEEGAMKNLLRLLGGVFLAVTVLQSLTGLELPDPEDLYRDFREQGLAAATMGEELASRERLEIIKGKLTAYILDKADALGARVEVQLTLDENGCPVHAALTGSVSPYVRRRLQQILREDLGIPEEEQQWNG